MEARNSADGIVAAFDEALHQIGARTRTGHEVFDGFSSSVHESDALAQRAGCKREHTGWSVPSNGWKRASRQRPISLELIDASKELLRSCIRAMQRSMSSMQARRSTIPDPDEDRARVHQMGACVHRIRGSVHRARARFKVPAASSKRRRGRLSGIRRRFHAEKLGATKTPHGSLVMHGAVHRSRLRKADARSSAGEGSPERGPQSLQVAPACCLPPAAA